MCKIHTFFIISSLILSLSACNSGTSNLVNPNNLAFGSLNFKLNSNVINVHNSTTGTAYLLGSNGIKNLILQVGSANESIAIVQNGTCNISDKVGCNFTVIGVQPGTTQITLTPISWNAAKPDPVTKCVLSYCPQNINLHVIAQ